MEVKGLIERRPNPEDGRGVLIHLTDFGREKRADSKNVVLRFNETVREHVTQGQLDGFFSVVGCINQLISEKKIYFKEKTSNT
jgi:DNA-binding MarR family transcriptional regulator